MTKKDLEQHLGPRFSVSANEADASVTIAVPQNMTFGEVGALCQVESNWPLSARLIIDATHPFPFDLLDVDIFRRIIGEHFIPDKHGYRS